MTTSITPEVKETSLTAHVQKDSSGVKKGGALPHNRCCQCPIGCCAGIHLGKKMHTHMEKRPGSGQRLETKQDDWPEKNKHLEKLPPCK